MTAIPYRPKLNRLIDTSVLPDSLSFVSDTADDVLSYFSVSDLNISLSESRDFKYYSLKLHTDKKIGFTIPIFNITILLNPPDETGTVNEAFFDITFFRKWELLKYINELDTADILNFSFSEYFDLIKNMFNLSDEKLIHSVIKNFVVPPCDGQILNTQSLDIKQYFNDFITEINTLISSSNPPIDISSITNPDFLDLVNAIKNSSLSIIEVVEHFINIDPNNSKINLLSIIKPWFSNFTWERILEIVLPQYYLSINEITLGIEFTRNILKPIDPVTGEPDTNENNKTIVRFTVGDLVFSSKRGFDFSEEYSLTIPESEILNTGLILDVSAAKLDLSSKKNIPEATADGRPVTFTGVFIESVKILLPPEWGTPKDSQGAPLPSGVEILCSNLLIGNEGGVSGLIGVSGYVFEYYIDFEISGTNKITYDSTSDKITIEGLDNKQKVIQAQSSGDTYIRDVNKARYHIDSSDGSVSTLAAQTKILNYSFDNGLAVSLDSFSIEFKQNSIENCCVVGKLTLPLKKDNEDIVLDIVCSFGDGFNIKVINANGTPLVDNNNVKIELNGFEIGKHDTVWRLGFAGSIENRTTFPAVEKLIPKKVDIKEFLFETGEDLNYDVEIEWPDGLIVKGSDEEGLSAYIPLNKEIGEFASIEGIRIMIDNNNSAGTDLMVELHNAGLNLGPASVNIDGFGMKATFTEASTNGNLGPFDVDVSLIPPTGLSISVESDFLSGSGFLIMDHDEGSYMGGLVLSFKDISLSAIGILNTKMPDGSKGFSLLVIITATFTPAIQLGLGFTLNGVGGLLGIHRTVKRNPLRDGVKNGTLDMILFPSPATISTNALSLITNVATIFPVMQKHFVVGPMAKIGWGSPSIITLDFGILIEIPDPTLYILGILKAILPKEEDPIVKLQVNFMGVLDFKNKEMMFYASLFNSKILTYTLSGDMGVLMNWGDNPMFILSAGGFHPNYVVPPSNLPALNRMSLILADEENLKVGAECYFAVTSNTVQFGARLYLDAKSGKYFLRGDAGLDVLIQFSPFYFIAAIYFIAEAGRKNTVYLSVSVSANIEGPNTWHIWGKASFKVLKVNASVSFNETIGQKKNDVQGQIAITTELLDTLVRNDSWEAFVPDNFKPGVTLIDFETNNLYLHPNGSLRFNQTFIPFGFNMQKFGNSKLSDAKKFTLSDVKVAGTSTSFEMQKDFFAPGEYLVLSKQERLSKKSFELFQSGAKINGSSDVQSASVLTRNLTKGETVVVLPLKENPFYQVNTSCFLNAEAISCFTSDNGFNDKNTEIRSVGLVTDVDTVVALNDILEETFNIANVNDLVAHDSASFTSYQEAEQYLESIITSSPELEEDLMVMSM